MERFARVVLGYHGCLEPRASDLLTGKTPIAGWPRSTNRWDWLGHGIYFWEHSPGRALQWAQERAASRAQGETPAVVGAVISLGTCLDLTDIAFTTLLATGYDRLKEAFAEQGLAMPVNKGGPDAPRRDLDCAVINYLANQAGSLIQTARCPFWEGEPAYEGAMIRSKSHVQIAVRDSSCILGVFRPNLDGTP